MKKENDQIDERISHISKHFDSHLHAQRFAQARTGKIIFDKEFKTVLSNLDLDSFASDRIRALDIGCSSGRYTEALVSKGIETVGLDTAIIPLTYAHKRLVDGKFARASITSLPFKGETFDLLLCIGLLNHFLDGTLEEIIAQIGNMTKPGGTFVFDVKNSLNPVVRCFYWMKDRPSFTLKCRTIGQFTKLVGRSGFEVRKKKGLFFPIAMFAPFVIIFCQKVR